MVYLKGITLVSGVKVYYKGDRRRLVDEVYDIISVGCLMAYYQTDRFEYVLGGKVIRDWKELKLVYGVIDDIKGYVIEFGVLNKGNIGSVIEDLEGYESVISLIKGYVKDVIIGMGYGGQEELNGGLEDILQYGLYDDAEFSKLSEYYSHIVFGSSVAKVSERADIDLGDVIVNVNIDEADKIPDELLEFRERQIVGNEGFDFTGLKKVLKYSPKGWQRFFLVAQKKFSFIVCSRQSGKSFTASYIALRQLFKQQQDVIYVVPNFDVAEQPFTYMERFARDIGDRGLRFDRARRIVSYDVTRSVIRFVSAESKMTGRGKKADLLIIDEASFISDNVYRTVLPMIATTDGKVVAISTPSPETPINWFYFGFKKGELGIDKDYLGIRVDIFKNPFWSDEMKLAMIKEYENDPVLGPTELYAMFLTGVNGFNIKNFFIHENNFVEYKINGARIKMKNSFEDLSKEYKQYIIGYDPALLQDQGAVVIIGVKEVIENENGNIRNVNRFEIIGGGYITMPDYITQIDIIKELQMQLENGGKNVDIAFDYTAIGIGLYDLMKIKGLKKIHRVYWVGQGEAKYEDGYWRVSKKDLMSMFMAGMGSNVFGYDFLQDLKSEMEMYGQVDRMKGSHFDLISACVIAYFISLKVVGTSVDGSKKKDYIDYNNEISRIFGFNNNNSNYSVADRMRKFIY